MNRNAAVTANPLVSYCPCNMLRRALTNSHAARRR
jgi:hypothetical protein